MTSLERKLLHRVQCLCKRIEDLETIIGDGVDVGFTLYTGDGELADPRTVDGNGNDLTFTDLGTLLFSANTLNFEAPTGVVFGDNIINFNTSLPSNIAPTHLLSLSSGTTGDLNVSTIAEVQTALGIGAGALTAGYIAYGTGTGITGEAEFFYDTTNNRLGIGTSTPSTSLHISAGVSSGVITLESDNAAFMSIYRYSNNVTRPRYETYKARGTKAVPLTVQTGDELAAFDFYGHNGSAFQRNATIYTTVRNVSGTNITAQMNFGFGFSGGATDHYQAFSAAGALFTNTTATSKTPTSIVDINRDNLGAVQTTSSGLALTNTTVATVGAQQISPAIRWQGSGWKTNATAASQTVEFRADVLPVQGSSAPTGILRFQSSINGAAFSDVFNISNTGSISVPAAGAVLANNFNSTNYNTTITFIGYTGLIYTPATLSGSSATNAFDISQTWNTTGNPTIIKANVTNTASGANALLMDLQVGATSMFSVSKAGALIAASGLTLSGGIQTLAASIANSSFYVAGSSGGSVNGGVGFAGAANSGVRVQINGVASITATSNASSANLILGNTQQTINSTGTHPVFANLAIKGNVINAGAGTLSNYATLYIEGIATGAVPTNNYALWVDDGISRFDGVVRLRGYTVGTLPTGVVGDTAYVTDALAPAYNTVVAGGGAVTVRVFFDGTNWVT